MEATLGEEEHEAGQRMALQITDRLVTNPTRRKTQARPMTQGMRKNPSMKVTDPHSISATDAPSSIVAAAAGDIPGDLAAAAVEEEEEGEMMAASSAHSSRISRE